MKILSIPTRTTSDDGYEIDGDLTLFFELTDVNYNNLKNRSIFDSYEFLEICEELCDASWNVSIFEYDDEMELDYTATELTTNEQLSLVDWE